MFTCMDITMAPGGQGGRWHIVWTDLPFSLLGINIWTGDFFKEEEKGKSEVNQSMGSQQIPALITTHRRLGSVRGSK